MTKSPIILQTSPFPNNGYASENQKSTSKNKQTYIPSKQHF